MCASQVGWHDAFRLWLSLPHSGSNQFVVTTFFRQESDACQRGETRIERSRGRKFITEGGTDPMEIKTTRFGTLKVEAADLIQFPGGLPGLEACRQWVLLTDAGNECLGWLQSAQLPEIALAVVSPRRFVPNYQLRVSKSELEPLALSDVRQAQVLVIVSKHDGAITLNLKAPLVINAEGLIGRQVVANGDLPVQYSLVREPMPLRKSA
jgi:flagellar assembly factor FliW